MWSDEARFHHLRLWISEATCGSASASRRQRPWEMPGPDTEGPRLPVPVHISIHNVRARAFNHSDISNEIQLQSVINDGAVITANIWPSTLRHADTPWNSDPKEAQLRWRTTPVPLTAAEDCGRLNGDAESVLKYLTWPSLPWQHWKLWACLCFDFFFLMLMSIWIL